MKRDQRTKTRIHIQLLSPAQSGFRQHHSTESAVIYFTDEIRRNADAGRLTGALFLDLKKL